MFKFWQLGKDLAAPIYHRLCQAIGRLERVWTIARVEFDFLQLLEGARICHRITIGVVQILQLCKTAGHIYDLATCT